MEKVQVGDILYTLPNRPPKDQIEGYSLSKKQQKFKRVEVPKNFATEQERESLARREMNRRLNGYWFYNNGTPTYITGSHYFYLNYWFLGGGYPEYRETDRFYYYFWDYVVKDPNCYGIIYLTNRRSGKSERALCELYEATSRTPDVQSGIQDRTDGHAKDLFAKLVRSWKKLPDFFKPIDEGETAPKTALRFFEPGKRSSKSKEKKYEKALNSFIDYGSSKEEEYDGSKQFRYFRDETGKTTQANVVECWRIVKECLALGRDIVGKAILPTTVEEMEKMGGKNFKELWDSSNFNKRDSNGRTESGLYRLFKPAYEGFEGFIDEYGNSIIEDPEPGEKIYDKDGRQITMGSKTFLLNRRASLTGAALASEKRKFPFTEDEAFDMVFGDLWEPDVKEILTHVKKEIQKEEPPITCAKFFEVGGLVQYNVFKDPEGCAKIVEHPRANAKYIVGYDGSASDKQTGANEGSKVAITVLKGFEGLDKENYLPVCTYSIRPERLEDAYQMILLICKYYGQYNNLQIIGESNAGQASPVVAYFANRGCLKYIMKRPKNLGFNYNDKTEKFWIYRNGDVKDAQIKLANMWIRRYGQNIKILSLVDDLIKLGTENADEADSFLMAILGFGDFDKTETRQRKPQERQIRVVVYKNGKSTYQWKTVPR